MEFNVYSNKGENEIQFWLDVYATLLYLDHSLELRYGITCIGVLARVSNRHFHSALYLCIHTQK